MPMQILNKKLGYCRGTARRTTSLEILSTASHLYKNNTWKPCSENDLKCVSRSSELSLFDGPLYHFLLVVCTNIATTLPGTVSEILPHLLCTWLALVV